jgi:hypothetical protein
LGGRGVVACVVEVYSETAEKRLIGHRTNLYIGCVEYDTVNAPVHLELCTLVR